MKIWVGYVDMSVRKEVKTATTLKGLCELIGVSYSTAKSKKVDGGFILISGKDLGELLVWEVREVELVKVSGRGSKEGFRVGKGK